MWDVMYIRARSRGYVHGMLDVTCTRIVLDVCFKTARMDIIHHIMLLLLLLLQGLKDYIFGVWIRPFEDKVESVRFHQTP